MKGTGMTTTTLSLIDATDLAAVANIRNRVGGTLRAPHYTCSDLALMQEVGMASGGTLYLDDFISWRRGAILALVTYLTLSRACGGGIPREIVLGGSRWNPELTEAERKYRRKAFRQRARLLVKALRPLRPECGHSACSQHYIDTGSPECVQEGGEA